MPRQILIVDDNAINRQLLGNTIRKYYAVLEATNGEEALERLHQNIGSISAVLLDIAMPVMDGYEVLRRVRSDEDLAQIPVIMATGSEDEDSRVKAISLGANDFILKPYNPDIILHCLKNNIALRETIKTVNILQYDYLTGLYSREMFFSKARDMVSAHEAGYYIMASFDVDRFKVINDQYGTEKGDEVLRYIAQTFKAGFSANGGIVCRLSADDFAILYPASYADSDEIKEIYRRISSVPGLLAPVVYRIGRYLVDDLSLSPSAMYDRAMLAAESIKGKYDVQVAFYDEALRKRLLDEQSIVNEMRSAIQKRQFEVWYQPQYNHATGALIGAEALVRWRHPVRGLISPAMFIPIFERNGFIYELDKYVWEMVCLFLRRGLDAGYAPLPVSVNISRYDVLRSDIIEVITGLVQKYDLPADLLRLEITESAFAESTKEITAVVRRLIDCGFTLEIDDFGSGYSSLNTLKSVPAHIIKLDLRFFEDDEGTGRSGNIIESVVRMAKWLDMVVIAEGVEELAHADYLKSIGCNYIQGYLYSKPIPEADYIALVRENTQENKLMTIETVEHLDNNEFWNPKSMETLIFNSYIGGACIFEYQDRMMEMLRVNDQYLSEFGRIAPHGVSLTEAWFSQLVSDEEKSKLESTIALAYQSKKEASCELKLSDGKHIEYIYGKIRVIARTGERLLCYCVIQNITAQRELEIKERDAARQLAAIMGSIESGVTASVFHDESNVELIFANDGFYSLLGYTAEQWKAETANLIDLILPEDREKTLVTVRRLLSERSSAAYEYRCLKRDGSVMWMRTVNTVISLSGVGDTVLLAVSTDITAQKQTEQKQTELLDNLPCGTGIYEYKDNTLSIVYLNKSFWQLIGQDVPSASEMLGESPIHPDDMPVIARELAHAVAQRRELICDIRLSYQKTEFRKVHLVGRVVAIEDGVRIYVTFTPIENAAIAGAGALNNETIRSRWEQLLLHRDPKTFMLFRSNISRNTVFDSVTGTLLPAAYPETLHTFDEQVAHYTAHLVHPDDRAWYAARLRSEMLLARFYGGERNDVFEYRELTPDGGCRWIKCTMEFLEYPNSNDVEAYLLYEDIDEAKREELLIKEQAETEPLTGLYNRKAFVEKFVAATKKTRSEKSALFIIDLDGFKRVNDSFGHAVGDETLIELAQKLRAAFRAKDILCRLGGDEFLVGMTGILQPGIIADRAALVCATLHKSFSLEIQLSASVGIAVFPDDGRDFDTLYRKADAALYHVKGSGKDGYAIYSDDMKDERLSPEMAIVGELAAGSRSSSAPKRRMLIVDDNELNRDLLVSLFDEEFIVDTAAEGTAALTRIRRYGSGISVVLLDLMMPGISGFDVLDQMRASPAMQSIPVVVVSGTNDRETSLEAIRRGAADFVTKPVDPAVLRVRVASALSRAENERLRAQNRYLAMQNEETRRLAEAKRHTEELTVALHAAEQADIAKTQFLSSMSHEIRTPLNAIIGYNTLARNEINEVRTDADRRQAEMRVMDSLAKSEIASRHLLSIINDVLDMSAIESGKMKVEHAAFDFRALITALTVMFFSQARAKGVNFEVLFDKPVDEWFIGDQLRINQVLTNLLSNAVKFTPEGGDVTLTITKTEEDEKHIGFMFTVSDTGIGMTQEYLQHIWMPFEQAEASISRRFGGTGLGLSITKNLVEMMGGSINVESKSGIGSTFSVQLSLVRTSQPERAIERDFSGVNALVVDDDIGTCDYIKLLFDRCGASCTTFTTGTEAVNSFIAAKKAQKPYNLCLIDWRMPNMDGFATINAIRRIDTKELPIIVVTAYDFSEVAEHAETLSISKFVSKPLFQSSLFDLLANISGQSERPASVLKRKYDFEGARVLLVEDNNMNMEVAKRILVSANLAVDSAWNGQEASDIFAASKRGTYKMILMDVHMPVVDGYQATRMIRASKHPDAQTIPIVAMTADVFADDITQARNAGMDDHIAKPVDVDALYRKLAEYIEGGRK